MNKRILLLSGYDAESHRYWRELLERNLVEYDWTQVALPDRHFSWRMRGNSLSFAFNYEQVLRQDYDVLIVTSMVDLSSLRGFFPKLTRLPTLVYFHENQFAYPASNYKKNEVNIQLTSIYTALCADKVLFNSTFNKQTFLAGCADLLRRLPDEVPPGLDERIANMSSVVPVPLHNDLSKLAEQPRDNEVPHIVWNHRWEYDKQPEVFFDALKQLKAAGGQFKLHIMGQSFRDVPTCFTDAKTFFEDEIISYGYLERPDYLQVLAQSDYVLSSTLHDFQGLSLQEAISLGCIPIAPRRMAYPEYIHEGYLYEPADTPAQESDNLFRKLSQAMASASNALPDLSAFRIEQVIPKYAGYINQLLSDTCK